MQRYRVLSRLFTSRRHVIQLLGMCVSSIVIYVFTEEDDSCKYRTPAAAYLRMTSTCRNFPCHTYSRVEGRCNDHNGSLKLVMATNEYGQPKIVMSRLK